MLLMVSIGICMSYPRIREQVEKNKQNVSISRDNDFLYDLNKSCYALYYDIQKKKKSGLEPADVYYTGNKKNNRNDNGDYDYDKERINELIWGWKRNLDKDLRNLEYYAVDKTGISTTIKSNYQLDSLLTGEVNEKQIEELNREYLFYVVIKYDDKGGINVEKVHGSDKLAVYNGFLGRVSNELRNEDLDVNSIKDTTFIFAVPKELKYVDKISNYNNKENSYYYYYLGDREISIGLTIILIIGVLIPLKYTKELVGVKKIFKIPFEILIFIPLFTFILINENFRYIIGQTINGELSNQILDFLNISINISWMIAYAINIIYWTIAFGIILFSVVIAKSIFSYGIKKYIHEHTIIFKIARGINKSLDNIIHSVDLKEKNNKKIIGLLLVNLIILIVISFMWFFGIIVAIIYTLILFKKIMKYLDDISSKYNKLLQGTSKIAQGNLDVTIEEDLGVFEPFKEEIVNIQKGFKKAVDEEVKSQKMKTELISNVSHDLKTPLTSIITYVDLLKNHDISEEKRMTYLDTLDRKSQRLQELIEDLFEVSKASSGNISLNIVDVDVVSLMKQTLFELNDKISKASLKIKSNFSEEKVVLPLDSQRIFRVFENLIINITKYAMTGSRVYIDILDKANEVEIIFKNITEEEIDFNVNEIVERFVRGDKSRNTEGSGLGLAIAKSFVELQHGKFNIVIDGDLFKVILVFNKNK